MKVRTALAVLVLASARLVPSFCSLAPDDARASSSATRPRPPERQVDLTPPASGRVLSIRAGGDFQAALHAAEPGDTLELEAGAIFRGPFTLPAKAGDGWIVIRSSAIDALPRRGSRVSPTDATHMPVLEAEKEVVIATQQGAHHYWFSGLEIRPRPGAVLLNLVVLGSTERTTDSLPHHFVFDRCYLHGDPIKGARRGIAMNAAAIAVVDSHLSDFKEAGADTQAIASWNGAGPFAIINNHLEAAGENVMFGGADPTIHGLVPADIEIRRNHFFKPLSWKIAHPQYAGTPWTVKNLLELKNARRVRVDGNVFEHNWPQAQNGFAILFTVRNQDGGAPWSVVEDVTFSNNIVRHVGAAINILGRDDLQRSQPTERVLIVNNLFDAIGGEWGSGRLFQLLDGTVDVVIQHNTAVTSGEIIVPSGAAQIGFVFQYNIVFTTDEGREPRQRDRSLLRRFFREPVVSHNGIGGDDPYRYPSDNRFPKSLAAIGFEDAAAGNYRLTDASPLRDAAADRRAIGVDMDALLAAHEPSSDRRTQP